LPEGLSAQGVSVTWERGQREHASEVWMMSHKKTLPFKRILVALVLLLTACAEPGSVPGGDESAPEKVIVGGHDPSQKVTVERGKALIVALETSPVSKWVMRTYPRNLLRLVSSNEDGNRYEFEATRRGTGVISFINLRRGPHPSSCPDSRGAGQAPECPIANDVADGFVPPPSFTSQISVVVK
jgi:hypothetical protein